MLPRLAYDVPILLPWQPVCPHPPKPVSPPHNEADIFSVFLLHRCDVPHAAPVWKTDGPHLFRERDIAEMYLADKIADELVMRPTEWHSFVSVDLRTFWKLHKHLYVVRSSYRFDIETMQKLLRVLPPQHTTLVHWELKRNQIKDV